MLMMRSSVSAQCRDAQVPGAGQRECGLHGLAIADFADQNHVRSRPHRAAQRPGEALGVEPDLALIDDGLLVGMQELDRILDGQDMVRGGLVAVVDHGGERGRLSRAGRPHHEDQAALQHDQLLEDLGHAQILELRHLGRDVAQHHRGIPALIEDVDAESP
jgi:hypothetical protein